MGSTPVGLYSASGISAILGLNPYKTAVHAWQEIQEKLEPGFNKRMSYTLPVFEESAAIRWGLAFEGAVIQLAEEKEGSVIVDLEKLFVKDFDEFSVSCHIDGRYENDGYIHEGKTTNSRAFYMIKEDKLRWGDPGTDEVPEEYQVQAAVQRICTGAELVKLSVLVFPKTADDFEALGWSVIKSERHDFEYRLHHNEQNEYDAPIVWAEIFQKIGNFHTYNLPTNKKLESLIIEKIQKFDQDFVKTRMPPTPQNYSDVRRLLTSPMGTILATEGLKKKALEYSEIVRQTGSGGPLAKRKEALKTEILAEVMNTRKDDWSDPPNKLILVDPNGGDILASFGKDRNGNTSFRGGKVK